MKIVDVERDESTHKELKRKRRAALYAREWRAKNRKHSREYARTYMRQYRATPHGAARCKRAEREYYRREQIRKENEKFINELRGEGDE